ncbi:hypothetical protein REPUB_Repub12eG0060100 [Reevesia pubescens]
MRWAILRSPCFYPVKKQVRIITACCLLHNLIRSEMHVDPAENDLDNDGSEIVLNASLDVISMIEASDQWAAWRDNLAMNMFNDWKANKQ